MDRKINTFVKKLRKKKLTVAFAESMTCGMAASKLATCPGTSEVFIGSIICYSPEVKCELMSIPRKTIDKHSCESREVTELLARKLPKLIHADAYGAVTGLAAEGGSERPGKPVGTVFISVLYKNKMHSKRKLFRGSPSEIREKACLALYKLISDVT